MLIVYQMIGIILFLCMKVSSIKVGAIYIAPIRMVVDVG